MFGSKFKHISANSLFLTLVCDESLTNIFKPTCTLWQSLILTVVIQSTIQEHLGRTGAHSGASMCNVVYALCWEVWVRISLLINSNWWAALDGFQLTDTNIDTNYNYWLIWTNRLLLQSLISIDWTLQAYPHQHHATVLRSWSLGPNVEISPCGYQHCTRDSGGRS